MKHASAWCFDIDKYRFVNNFPLFSTIGVTCVSHGILDIWDDRFFCVFFNFLCCVRKGRRSWGGFFLAVGGRSSMRKWQLTATLGDLRWHMLAFMNYDLESAMINYPSLAILTMAFATRYLRFHQPSLLNFKRWLLLVIYINYIYMYISISIITIISYINYYLLIINWRNDLRYVTPWRFLDDFAEPLVERLWRMLVTRQRSWGRGEIHGGPGGFPLESLVLLGFTI